MLRSRVSRSLGEEELATFQRGLHLYATSDLVKQHNLHMLGQPSSGATPVARIRATHTGPAEARKAPSDKCQGLSASLDLCVGAKVRLRNSIWVEQGLVNGALGYVHAMPCEGGVRPPHLPFAVLVRSPSYRGPSCLHDVPRVVPILPRTAHCSLGPESRSCSRRQLPLALAWAATIHK